MAELITTPLFNDANLQAYYRLEDLTDSKNSNTLTNTNSVTFTSARYGNGANFGNSNTNKVLTTSNTLNIAGGACSFVGWIKLNAEITSATWALWSHYNSTGNVRTWIEYDYNGGAQRLIFQRDQVGSVNNNFTYTITLGTSNFYHIAWTYDTSTIRGYVNGAQIGSVASSGTAGSFAIDQGFRIGALMSAGSNTEFASILADDVAVFNKTLSAAEIAMLYADSHIMKMNKFW